MIIDIVVGAIIVISGIISFLRGLIRETLTIAGVAGGIFAALFFGPKLSPIFKNWLGVTEDSTEKLFNIVPMGIVADICAYASIFIIVVIIISIISHFISGAAKALGLGPIDRTLGVIFGILRAVILLALIYLPFHLLMDEDSKAKYFADSKTHIYIEKTASFMAGFLPSSDDVETKIDETESDIKRKLFENNILNDKNAARKNDKKSDKTETGYNKGERLDLNKLILETPDNKNSGAGQPNFNN